MPANLFETYNEVDDKLRAVKAYQEIRESYDEQRQKVGEEFRKGKEETLQLLDSVVSQPKRFQRETKTQLDKLFDLLRKHW